VIECTPSGGLPFYSAFVIKILTLHAKTFQLGLQQQGDING